MATSGLTDAMISSDMGYIDADLAQTGATETVTWEGKNQNDGQSGSFGIIRQAQMKKEELQDTGFEDQYKFTVKAYVSAVGALDEGDIVIMSDSERLRVLGMDPQPAKINVMIHLGSEFQRKQ